MAGISSLTDPFWDGCHLQDLISLLRAQQRALALASLVMKLNRVLLISCLLLCLQCFSALSLDLEGLKDQASSQITGEKLMDIVSLPRSHLVGIISPESKHGGDHCRTMLAAQ